MHREDILHSITELNSYLQARGFAGISGIPETSFHFLLPKYYANLINWNDTDDPLRLMVLPSTAEHVVQDHELSDPIGDTIRSPVPGIVHRYPDRCLLMLTNACAVHCRFCFRRNILTSRRAHLEESIAYIRSHPNIWEVILSGGDPFTFPDEFMEKLIGTIRTIPHVRHLRFHTRIPAVLPARVTARFVTILKHAGPATVIVHVNHPREVTREFREAVVQLRAAGLMVLSQTVLMNRVNDDGETLTQLFRSLIEAGVKPYYLHHPDIATGTHHFRVSVERGKRIMKSLRGNVSGICLPEYVIDTPGGYGKIPVFWFMHHSDSVYKATSFEGKNITYRDPAT